MLVFTDFAATAEIIDAELADTSLYADEQRERLREVTAVRAETERDLQDCEARWLALSETIEALEAGGA